MLVKLLKQLKTNQSGFSLAEVMVAVGVTGVLAVGTMHLAELNTKAQRTDDVISARSYLATYFKKPQICTATLQTAGILQDSGVGSPITNITDGSKNFVSVSSEAADINAWISSPGVATENAINPSPAAMSFGNSVMISSMTAHFKGYIRGKVAGSSTSNKNAMVEIKVTMATKNSTAEPGSKISIHQKSYFVNAIVTPGNVVVACGGEEMFGAKQAEKQMCEEVGGTFDAAGNCANPRNQIAKMTVLETCAKMNGSYSATNNTCVPRTWGFQCPGTTKFNGYAPNGCLICSDGATTTTHGRDGSPTNTSSCDVNTP